MQNQDKEHTKLKGIFPETSSEEFSEQFDSKDYLEADHSNQLYALSSDDSVLRKFKIILRCGRTFRIPYAVLPIVELSDSKDRISIMAYGLLITIEGKGLEVIEEYLAEEILLWLKESPSKKDDGTSRVFISKIILQGKAISKHVE